MNTNAPTSAKLVRSEHRFEPPPDAEPVATRRPGLSGWVIAYIHPGDAELAVVVHSTVGVTATVTGSLLHEVTGRAIRMSTVSQTWTPEKRGGFDDLAEAPEWVRDAVEQVAR